MIPRVYSGSSSPLRSALAIVPLEANLLRASTASGASHSHMRCFLVSGFCLHRGHRTSSSAHPAARARHFVHVALQHALTKQPACALLSPSLLLLATWFTTSVEARSTPAPVIPALTATRRWCHLCTASRKWCSISFSGEDMSGIFCPKSVLNKNGPGIVHPSLFTTISAALHPPRTRAHTLGGF